MRSFNGDFPPWICSGRQRRRGEGRHHPLGNKPWKNELRHQESALDKKLGEVHKRKQMNIEYAPRDGGFYVVFLGKW